MRSGEKVTLDAVTVRAMYPSTGNGPTKLLVSGHGYDAEFLDKEGQPGGLAPVKWFDRGNSPYGVEVGSVVRVTGKMKYWDGTGKDGVPHPERAGWSFEAWSPDDSISLANATAPPVNSSAPVQQAQPSGKPTQAAYRARRMKAVEYYHKALLVVAPGEPDVLRSAVALASGETIDLHKGVFIDSEPEDLDVPF